jgi:hypothetical protein
MKTALITVAIAFAFSSVAFAKDGRFARPSMVNYYAKKGWSTDIRVHKVKDSRSGKSLQIAVETKASGQVRAFNVRKESGKAYNTPTALTKQSTARGTANQLTRREPGVRANKKQPGTFSGLNSAGLSASGKSMKINSATDRNQATYVKLLGGKAIRFDQ